MTRRRELARHRRNLVEIRGIMNSMKTLAYLETRKLTRFLDPQNAVVRSIEEVAQDLLSFHPEILPGAEQMTAVCILVGTERGFCGDFNHALLAELENAAQPPPAGPPLLIPIGRKLFGLLEKNPRLAANIEGASVVEEVQPVIMRLVDELNRLQQTEGMLTVSCLYHAAGEQIVKRALLPPFTQFGQEAPRHAYPPLLHGPPRDLLGELTDHYLFAALHEMLYTSLMVENRHRIAHLEGAMRHLDELSARLVRQGNMLRQEEIIEEIEVILLSADSLAGGHP